jgi:hypothetical protein
MYQVELRDRTNRESGWFDSEITGTHDHCYSQVRTLSLDLHFEVRITHI